MNRTAVFWYQIDPGVAQFPIVQSGVLDPGVPDAHHFVPSIAVNAEDDVCLGFSRSDDTRFVEAVVTGRLGGDAAGVMEPISVLKAGEAGYFKTFGFDQNRWGDYSATSVDPTDNLTFWTIQEYAASPSGGADRWGTYWGKIAPAATSTTTLTPTKTPSATPTRTATLSPTVTVSRSATASTTATPADTPTPTSTPTRTPTPTPTLTTTGTSTFTPTRVPCRGDCSGDRIITRDELVHGVRIALGTLPFEGCDSFDSGGDKRITVEELVTGVNTAAKGCDPPSSNS